MKKSSLLISIFLLFLTSLGAQSLVVQTESYESTIFPAPGWKVVPGSNGTGSIGEYSLIPAIYATHPSIGSSPSGGGLNVVKFNSFSSANNSDSYLISKPFDFSNNGGTNPVFSFWMYRDAASTGVNDRILVYSNSSPDTLGMVSINHAGGVNFINRPIGSFPFVMAEGWYQYTFSLPAANYNGKKNYFIIHAISELGENIYLDKFVCNTHSSAMSIGDVSFDVFKQNQSTTSQSATNQWILGVRCVVGGNSGCGNLNGPLPVKLDSLFFATNGTTNVADILNAKIYYTGGSNVFSTGYVSPFPTSGIPANTSYPKTQFGSTVSLIGTNINFANAASSCFFLEYDTTYFWITYDISATAASNNYLDADFLEASVGGSALICPSPAGTSSKIPANTSTIQGALQVDLPYCVPTYTFGTSQNGYTNNDYLQSVSLMGYNGTNINTTTNSVFLQNAALPCYPNCRFTNHPPDYEFRNSTLPNQSVTLQQGASYSITVQAGTAYSGNNISAWIDYNHNGLFEAAELLGTQSLLANASATYNFTLPALGYFGNTRMRVREVSAIANPDPCLNYSYGECEDFLVTIIQNCSPLYILWLGNSNDWNSPANWCPSIPTINDDVVIDKTLGITINYFNPIIKSGVQANCKNITIALTDTLTIDAPNTTLSSPANFKASGTVTNNGQIRFTTSYTPLVNIATGTLLNYTQTPLCGKTYKAGQTQIIYTAAELAGYGLLAGDQITAIKLNVKNNDLVTPVRTYNNFTISYLNSAAVPLAYGSTNAIGGAFTNVYSNAVQSVVFGVNTFILSTPINWNGVDNICLQYCFTNAITIGSVNNDYIDVTQTSGRNSVLILGRIPASIAVAPLPGAFVNQVVGDIAANGSTVPNVSQSINTLSELRPNATFVTSRPYGKAKVVVQGNFINNNSFLAGTNSSFKMDSSMTNHIGGTQPTTFYTFIMSKTTVGTTSPDNKRPIVLDNDITIQDTFYLTAGQMIMNGRTLTMTSPKPSAFWRTQLVQATGTPAGVGSGFLISENPASVVNWNVGAFVAPISARAIPFGNRMDTTAAAITYMPVTFLHKSGDLGTFKAATKYWAANAPVTDPPTVTHLSTYNSAASNAAQTTDRYWLIGKTGPQNPAVNFPTVDLTFRFSNTAAPATERPTAMSALNPGKAQPWRAGSLQWMRITANATLGVYTIPVGGVNANGTTITYTTSIAHAIIVGQAVTIAGIVPAGYNIVGAIVIAVTATTFTIANPTSLGVSTVAGTSTGAPAVGGASYNTQQTTLNYTQSYAQVVASLDSVRITNWDWPIAPVQGPPVNYPAAEIGDFVPWTITNNITPLGGPIAATPIVIFGTNVTNASCQNTADGAITLQVAGGTPPYTYLWSNGASTQNQNNLVAGIYTVIVTDLSAQTAAASFQISNTNLLPGVIDSIIGNTSACLPSNLTYSIPVVNNATNYQWSIPANATIVSGQGTNSILINFSQAYTSGNICVIASNSCGSTASSCITVTGSANIPATPSSIIGNNYGVCNSIKTYSVTNIAGVTYQWNVPAGATIISGQGSSAINVNFTSVFTTGSISVSASTGCGISALRNKTIYGSPNIPAILVGVSTFCAGDTIAFNSSYISGAISYTWTVPTNLQIISGQGTTKIKAKCIGGIKNGSVCVRAVNSCGVSGSNCYTVNAGGIPTTITQIVGSANGVCTSTKTYSVINQIGVLFTWTVPVGATILLGQGTNNISVSYSASFISGTISVVASSNCGVATSISKSIKAAPGIPSYITGPTINCYNQDSVVYSCPSSAGATSYDWLLPSGAIFISGQGTSTISVTFNSIAGASSFIKVRANNACGSSSYKALNLTFSQCFARTENTIPEISLYPNPANSEVIIDLGEIEDQTVEIKCVNVVGQVVYQNEMHTQDAILKLNTSSFAEGLYFITLNGESALSKTMKVMIER